MIATVEQRKALKPSPNAYFVSLGKGRHLGFRRLDAGDKKTLRGTWCLRIYDPTMTPKRREHALGDFAHLPASEHWTAAQKAAKDFLSHLEDGGTAERCTVAEACATYIERVRREKGPKAARTTESRLKALVCGNAKRDIAPDPIAKIDLRKLRAIHLEEWRTRITARPNLTRPGTAVSLATVNREIACVSRALNLAKLKGYVTSNAAWRDSLKPTPNVTKARDIYLTREQRDSLVANCDDALKPFVRALCLLPVRCGAVAALTVASFNRFTNELSIGWDKRHKPRKFTVPTVTAKFLAEQTKGKLPTDPLFQSYTGKAWVAKNWAWPVERAVKKAELPHVTLANLRHATITDLVVGGLDIFSVAEIAGTSVKMIQQHYGKLLKSEVNAALAKLAG